MAIWIDKVEQSLTRIVESIQELIKGNSNNIGFVTLRTGQATTVVSSPIIAIGAHIDITPRSAAAAAEVAAGGLYIDPVTSAGSFTIHHANNATTGRNFSWAATGGD